jgi:polar amino acid transport system substrate-binding protein
VTGAEPDVLQAVLDRMGYGKLEAEVVDYEAMIPGLQAGRWDVIAAGLFMKESRCAEVNYAEPVIVSTESYAVAPGNPEGILTVADVKSAPGTMVAAINGAFEEGILTTGGVPEEQILSVKDGISGVEALKAGRCAAFMLPTLSLQGIAENTDGFDITEVIPDAPKTGSSAAFKKDETDLFETYNAELEEFKKTPDFAEILKKWGFDAEAAQGVTTEELCQNPG